MASLRVPCERSQLRVIRAFVNEILKEKLTDEGETNLIVLAIDEICANLIIHANKGQGSQPLELFLELDELNRQLRLEIRDYGDFFDYAQYEEPNIEEIVETRTKGSLGLMLVRRIMTRIEFRRVGEVNLCSLERDLQSFAAA